MAKKETPKRNVADISHSLIKAGIAGLPAVGGSAAEIFSLIIVPPLSKRRDEWMKSIAEGLESLEKQVDGFKIEALGDNDTFITTVAHASQAAIRNHQKEKLDALCNAVLNAALPNAPEEDLQLMFLDYVDSLTTWHLAILKFLEDPREWGKKNNITYPDWTMGGVSAALEHAFTELRGKRNVYDVFVRELYNRGLIGLDNLHATGTGASILASRTTSMGQQFLSFITYPISETE